MQKRNRKEIRKLLFGSGRSAERYESDFERNTEAAKTLGSPAFSLGQRNLYPCPRDCPYPESVDSPLGSAMDIEDVAALLGCSPWTIRQKYLPQGLPHLRACDSGKFVFFREQVVQWILERQKHQKKGGM